MKAERPWWVTPALVLCGLFALLGVPLSVLVAVDGSFILGLGVWLAAGLLGTATGVAYAMSQLFGYEFEPGDEDKIENAKERSSKIDDWSELKSN